MGSPRWGRRLPKLGELMDGAEHILPFGHPGMGRLASGSGPLSLRLSYPSLNTATDCTS